MPLSVPLQRYRLTGSVLGPAHEDEVGEARAGGRCAGELRGVRPQEIRVRAPARPSKSPGVINAAWTRSRSSGVWVDLGSSATERSARRRLTRVALGRPSASDPQPET